MIVDIAQLVRHPSRHGTTPPRPSASLIELTRRHGPLQPVLVRPAAGRTFEILSNIETWLAAQVCGFREVPISVLDDIDDESALEILAAGLAAPSPLATVRRYGRLVEAERATRAHGAIARVARQCAVRHSTVARALRVLTLPAVVLKAVEVGALSVGHAYALLPCRSAERQTSLGADAISGRWSVRRLEDAVRTAAEPSSGVEKTGQALRSRDPNVIALERTLTEHLGSHVRLDEHGGTLTIDYRGSLEVLEGVLERLGLKGE